MGKATVVLVGSTGNGISLWTIDVFSYKLHRYIQGSVKEKVRKDKGKGSWNQNQSGKGWNSNQWNQSNWNQQWSNKGKGKDKGGKSKHGDKRVAAVENSKAECSNQVPQQPEPEITALFALEDMAERGSRRSDACHRSSFGWGNQWGVEGSPRKNPAWDEPNGFAWNHKNHAATKTPPHPYGVSN